MGPVNAAVRQGEHEMVLVEVPRPEEPVHAPDTTAFLTRTQRQTRAIAVLVVVDAIALLFTAIMAMYWHVSIVGTPIASASMGARSMPHGLLSAIYVVMTALVMNAFHLYDVDGLGWGSGEFTRVGRAAILGATLAVIVMLLLGLPAPDRIWILIVALLGFTSLVAGRGLVRLFESKTARGKGLTQRSTLVVGSNVEAAEVVRLLNARKDCGLVPVGCLRSSLMDQLSFDYCTPLVPTLGNARELRDAVVREGIDTVIIVASAFDYEVIKRMIKELRGVPVGIHISSALSEVLSSRVIMREVGGVPLISLRGISFSPRKLRLKRTFDSLVASLIILAGMPLWIIVAALIKIESPGPVFYKQERIGRDGVPFLMYKFRSMVMDADKRLRELQDLNEADGPIFKIQCDPRVTKVGTWIRKFSIDEFPQLINVLKSEMSLVGPRPPLPRETVEYSPHDWRRLEVPPGMTGLWQVSGRSDLSFREMVRLDCFYIDNWSLRMDMSLLVRTVPAVVLARGSC
ncbi:MAG: sugar transferase [Coriobacteriia bacterium]|jgi:exopolysaccharide biosynthesis polyprenyl glycosylphosphotransferase|nr:sugar transferase [Coriobacteriia bacterium]